MASQSRRKSSATPKDRPPAEDVARENYRLQFGTGKPDAELPAADEHINPGEPVGGVDESTTKTASKED